jgi:hypothetical protein
MNPVRKFETVLVYHILKLEMNQNPVTGQPAIEGCSASGRTDIQNGDTIVVRSDVLPLSEHIPLYPHSTCGSIFYAAWDKP